MLNVEGANPLVTYCSEGPQKVLKTLGAENTVRPRKKVPQRLWKHKLKCQIANQQVNDIFGNKSKDI